MSQAANARKCAGYNVKGRQRAEVMNKHYGPLMGGAELRHALGFKSSSAFTRARRLKRLGVDVFKIDGRRGYFALTADVAGWIDALNVPVAEEARGEVKGFRAPPP